MRGHIKLCLITAWLTAALLVLLMGTNLCVSTDEACLAAGETMFLLMLLLSFPTGIVFLFISMFFLETDSVHYPSDYIIAWFIMTCGGCLQWFIVVPRLLEGRKLTILDLKQDERSSKTIAVDVCSSAVRKRKLFRRIRAFDRHGRSPLGRVISWRL